jgi:hypothetical protein
MNLQEKTLAELTELRVTLLKRIQSNPEHSGLEHVELKDVNDWIELRIRERDHRRGTDPTF